MNRLHIFLIVTSLASLNGAAQNTEHQFFIWPQLFVRTNPETKLSYEGILQVRLLENLDNVQLAAITNTVYFKPDKISIYFGADYTFIALESGGHYRQVHWLQPKLEYRPKSGNVNFLFRLMYAHLWSYDLTKPEYKSQDERIRFLYQAAFPITNKIKLTINDELFILGRKSVMRENRFQCNLSTKIDNNNAVSIGYFFRWLGNTEQISKTIYENAVTVAYIYNISRKEK